MNKLLLYIILVIIMILFAHFIDKKYNIKNNKENFDVEKKYNIYVGSVIRLKVNLPELNTYTENVNENSKKKYFYLACVELNPNCNVIIKNKSCVPMFINNKQCNNNKLSIESNKNKYRLVLIHESQINKPGLSDTCNFVFQKINDKIYLKNIQNGHYPKLFTNDVFVPLSGSLSDDDKIINNNILCGDTKNDNTKNDIALMVTGSYNLDGSTYLLSTKENTDSSPVKLNFKTEKDNDIVNIQLEKYDQYGQVYDYYNLISANNFETSSIYTLNTISIDKGITFNSSSSPLYFELEIIEKNPEYIKQNYIKMV